MSDHEHRSAISLIPSLRGTIRAMNRKPVLCPACRLPFRPTDLLGHVDGLGWCHAFCADT